MNLKRLALTCTAAMVLAGTAAWAGDIDFTCSLGTANHCTGSITKSGSNYSTSGINVFNDSGPYNSSVPFELVFNTASGAVSIEGTGIYAGQNLVGDITSFGVTKGKTTTDVSFTADWPKLPPLVQTDLGSPTGTDSGSVIALTFARTARSVDVLITPTPEPGSVALFSSGLLAVGGFLRRKLTRPPC